MFATLSDRLAESFKHLRGKGRLSEADIDATAREIRIALLEADVALPVVKEFVGAVKERARGEEVSGALNPAQQIIKIVNEELVTILGGETRRLRYAKTGPTVIMLAGLQGAGKTTLAAKLALWLKDQGKTPILVAADLQRPNAVQQLQVNGERVGVPVFAPEAGNGVGDPVGVARASIEEAKRKLHDVVIIDTAGRLGVDAELMKQAADIRDAVQPDEVLFVVDAMIGQDAVTTAQLFLDGVGYDGVVLTKLDGDARGGAALSIASITGKPVMFASAGEKMTDFDLFHPDRMASRILDMGDMLTLIEQAEKTFDETESREAAEKLAPDGRLHPRGLPQADAAAPQARLDVEDHGDAARDGAVPRAARELRREGDRPHPGDHPVDDARRAGQPEADRRLAPRAHREGLGPAGLRRQPARRPLLRGEEDDAVDDAGRRHARHARDARCRAPSAPASAGPSSSRRRARASASSGNPAKAAQKQAADKAAAAEKAANPFGNAGEDVDYEKAAAALDLPKDFSKFLK